MPLLKARPEAKVKIGKKSFRFNGQKFFLGFSLINLVMNNVLINNFSMLSL